MIFTIVGFPADVRQVILGPDGVLAGCKPGNVVVDMTTSEPSLAVEIAQRRPRCERQASTRPFPAATSAPARPGCRS